MSVTNGRHGLRFACECVSGKSGNNSEPWAGIAKNKPLPAGGTKEDIPNVVADELRTISQIAEALGLSPPSVYTQPATCSSANSRVRLLSGRRHTLQSVTTSRIFPLSTSTKPRTSARLCEAATRVATLFKRHSTS